MTLLNTPACILLFTTSYHTITHSNPLNNFLYFLVGILPITYKQSLLLSPNDSLPITPCQHFYTSISHLVSSRYHSLSTLAHTHIFTLFSRRLYLESLSFSFVSVSLMKVLDWTKTSEIYPVLASVFPVINLICKNLATQKFFMYKNI